MGFRKYFGENFCFFGFWDKCCEYGFRGGNVKEKYVRNKLMEGDSDVFLCFCWVDKWILNSYEVMILKSEFNRI